MIEYFIKINENTDAPRRRRYKWEVREVYRKNGDGSVEHLSIWRNNKYVDIDAYNFGSGYAKTYFSAQYAARCCIARLEAAELDEQRRESKEYIFEGIA